MSHPADQLPGAAILACFCAVVAAFGFMLAGYGIAAEAEQDGAPPVQLVPRWLAGPAAWRRSNRD